MKKVRWGIVSTGRITHQFVQDFKYVSNGEVIAVASRSQASADAFAAQYAIERAYEGYGQLLEDPDVDVVYIATPHTLHYRNTMDAIQARKHILCEKPFTVGVREARNLFHLAEQSSVFVMEAMWTWFLPAIRKAREWVEQGRIGELRQVKADFGYPLLPFDPDRREYKAELGGGCLLEMGIYPVALALLFTQRDPVGIRVLAHKAPNGVEDDVSMLFDYGEDSDGAVATLGASFRSKLQNWAYIIGEEGYIAIPDFWRASECSLFHLDSCVDRFEDGRKSLGFNFETEAVNDDILAGRQQNSIMPWTHSIRFQEHMERVKDHFSGVAMIHPDYSKSLRKVFRAIGACLLFYSSAAWSGAAFEPPDGKVLVFIGQDNESVGGTENHQQGYADRIGVPAGITHYIYMVENKTNKFGYRFEAGTSEGLNEEVTWGAGPMCLRCYLESEKLSGTMIALAISLEFGGDRDMAAGKSDHLIAELADFLDEFSERSFLLRIGYEFEGSWNGYDSRSYVLSFRRIVDGLRARELDNFATVMQSASPMLEKPVWEEFYPGDDYVDWIGFSYWRGTVPADAPAYRFAGKHGKPLFIAESAPRGFLTPEADGESLWRDWFLPYFEVIERNPRIKAISYINANWESQPMWEVGTTGTDPAKRWGDSRIEANEELVEKWLEAMSGDRYLHGPVRSDPPGM